MANFKYFNRDLSWLSFNERVLLEAGDSSVPILERFRFLSIYSSNLDEFYRVRIPAYTSKKATTAEKELLSVVSATVHKQLELFGRIINTNLLPALNAHNITFLYKSNIPVILHDTVAEHFFNKVAGYLQVINLKADPVFFPVNNQLYKVVIAGDDCYVINIPSELTARFLKLDHEGKTFIVFLDDIIQLNLGYILPGKPIEGDYNFKLTRDASIVLIENEEEDPAAIIEKEIAGREKGKATRFLYDADMPSDLIKYLRKYFNLRKSALMAGGKYHHLKDLWDLPLDLPGFRYPKTRPLPVLPGVVAESLFSKIATADLLLHPPYHSYNSILRFFNEAALDRTVTEIYVTMYRVANDSGIAHSLISAAKNHKRVVVVVELKARFDEANNIRWSKKMKAAGIKIVYSSNSLKIHAKLALVKRGEDMGPVGLFSTGNFNETTASIYTDHLLLTSDSRLLDEMYRLFLVLINARDSKSIDTAFNHLLVAQFNLLTGFIALVDNEIENAGKGYPAYITIKLNNLEEELLISKLYEASNAGVKVNLIVRGICRLIPGLSGQSENITVIRIVDRYLEHGRVFIFCNHNQPVVYLGSADWMRRNIYHRIEVCFPVFDDRLKSEMLELIRLQLQDNVKAVKLDESLSNQPVSSGGIKLRSQTAIYDFLANKP